MKALAALLRQTTLVKTSLAAMLVAALTFASSELYQLTQPKGPGVVGIVWQPDNATVGISGDWDKLGAR
ncbi:hypothetical protein F2S88_32535, partial [Pseudomonas syringae pv. actinidiae]|nr:hypothetical protein [Pseudomonas syringae pv. actinidiae]